MFYRCDVAGSGSGWVVRGHGFWTPSVTDCVRLDVYFRSVYLFRPLL